MAHILYMSKFLMFNKLVNDEVTGNFVLQSNATKHVTKAVEES